MVHTLSEIVKNDDKIILKIEKVFGCAVSKAVDQISTAI